MAKNKIVLTTDFLENMLSTLTKDEYIELTRAILAYHEEEPYECKSEKVSICLSMYKKQLEAEATQGRKRGYFSKPSKESMEDFFLENGGDMVEADNCFYYYESNGWMVGRNKMKDWQAAARNWINKSKNKNNGFKTRYERAKESDDQLKAALARRFKEQYEREQAIARGEIQDPASTFIL